MENENEARVYGMADQANRDPPATAGVRGEQATDRPDAANPALKRVVTLDSGRLVEVREDSGVGWAEAAGRSGLANQATTSPQLAATATPTPQPPLLPLILALAAGVVAGTVAIGLRTRDRR
jgi:hypothetical protein